MNILRCRAYTRQSIRQHSTEVDQLEHVVNTVVHKLNIVRKENERYLINRVISNTLCLLFFCCYRLKEVSVGG